MASCRVRAHVFRLVCSVASVALLVVSSYVPLGTCNVMVNVYKQWINDSYLDTYGIVPGSDIINCLWAVVTMGYPIGGAIGSLLVVPLSLKWSRKAIICASACTVTVGSAFMGGAYPASSIVLYIVGRLVSSIGTGLVMPIAAIFVTEIAPVKYRGMCGIVVSLSFAVADLTAAAISQPTLLGTSTRWPYAVGIPGALDLILLISLCKMRKSPQFLYLVSKDAEGAEKSIIYYRGSDNLDEDMDDLEKESIRNMNKVPVGLLGVTKREYRSRLLVCLAICTGTIYSGMIAFTTFSTLMFHQAGVSFRNAKYATLGMTGGVVCLTIILGGIIDRVGRRKVVIVGFVGCIASNSILTVTTGLTTLAGMTQAVIPWISVVSLISVVMFYGCLEGVSLFVPSELFDQNARDAAVGFTFTWTFLIFAFQGITYPFMLQFWGVTYSNIPFVIVPLCCFIYVYFNLPETAGRSIESIVGCPTNVFETQRSRLSLSRGHSLVDDRRSVLSYGSFAHDEPKG